MAFSCDARLNSLRDFSRGKCADEPLIHPFNTAHVQSPSALPKHPAGFSRSLTNRLPASLVATLGCKYDADKMRTFAPFESVAPPAVPPTTQPPPLPPAKRLDPRPPHKLRVNETALGVRLGGKRQFNRADARR